jgi:hypothetical protein
MDGYSQYNINTFGMFTEIIGNAFVGSAYKLANLNSIGTSAPNQRSSRLSRLPDGCRYEIAAAYSGLKMNS